MENKKGQDCEFDEDLDDDDDEDIDNEVYISDIELYQNRPDYYYTLSEDEYEELLLEYRGDDFVVDLEDNPDVPKKYKVAKIRISAGLNDNISPCAMESVLPVIIDRFNNDECVAFENTKTPYAFALGYDTEDEDKIVTIIIGFFE